MELAKKAFVSLALVLAAAWVVSQILPNLIPSILSGAAPDLTFKNPLGKA